MLLSRHDYEYSVTGGGTTMQLTSWPPMAAPTGPRRTMKSLSQAIEENIGSDQGLVQGTVEDDDGFDSYLFAVVGNVREKRPRVTPRDRPSPMKRISGRGLMRELPPLHVEATSNMVPDTLSMAARILRRLRV